MKTPPVGAGDRSGSVRTPAEASQVDSRCPVYQEKVPSGPADCVLRPLPGEALA
jgi:hypothetical protein